MKGIFPPHLFVFLAQTTAFHVTPHHTVQNASKDILWRTISATRHVIKDATHAILLTSRTVWFALKAIRWIHRL